MIHPHKAVWQGALLVLCLFFTACSGLTAQKASVPPIETGAASETAWEIWPADQSQEVSVYPQLTITGADTIQTIQGYLQHGEAYISGDWSIEENTGRFSPYQVLEPGETYAFVGEVNGEPIQSSFTVTQLPLPESWIEVSLGEEQRVIIWQKGQAAREFPCSGGLPESPSLTGIYQLQDRGAAFYSQRFCEGARYWIRIQDQYLFHSVPRDENQQILQSELEKIGQAASHGCIRLYDEDAQWIYENMPKGTTVILHPAVPDLFEMN